MGLLLMYSAAILYFRKSLHWSGLFFCVEIDGIAADAMYKQEVTPLKWQKISASRDRWDCCWSKNVKQEVTPFVWQILLLPEIDGIADEAKNVQQEGELRSRVAD